jgi:hypothetical protein
MDRRELINRLVNRKLLPGDKRKALCVCLASPSRPLSFAAAARLRALCYVQARPKN